jgi:hypothetical protein
VALGVPPAAGSSAAHTIHITTVTAPAQQVVSVGSWYELSDASGWTFRPETEIDCVELALYDAAMGLVVGVTPFERQQTRASGLWPDGPENELGELGYEVSPGVLGDNNQHLYGKPYYRTIGLYGGPLSPDNVYQVSFSGTAPAHIWLHPIRGRCFTMSSAILQSSESTLTDPVYGPASVTRTLLDPDSTRFEYTGLSPDAATGLKDDYPVGDYEQRPGSHGNGDFGWFPGYSLWFHNEGPGSVTVALFVTTGFTGPSGAPSNTLANDTFWKSQAVFLPEGDSATVVLDFDDVRGFNLSDNPFPHTAGDQSVPDGTAGAAINIFDRLQVSAVGWEVGSGDGGPANASLVVTPRAREMGPGTAVDVETESPGRIPRVTNVVPNPFHYGTRIEYAMPYKGRVAIRVYDVRGRLVRTLLNRPVAGGSHSTFWDARDERGTAVPSGIYFVEMISFGRKVVRKVVLIR